MREIGSEFWDVPTTDEPSRVFPAQTRWFLSGRCALSSIIEDMKGCHTVAMPSWCCDSMVVPFVRAGIEVRFYPVYPENGGLRQIPRFDCDALFLMDYFGYTGTRPDLRAYCGTVIRDMTHSLFSNPATDDADYCFGSLRKWCGVWTGGFAWTREGHPLPTGRPDETGYAALREKAMQEKLSFLSGEVTSDGCIVTDKTYLKRFSDAEALLEHAGPAPAAERDVRLARQLDVTFMQSRRRENAAMLRAAFPDWLVFPEMGETDCPMFIPILVPDGRRDALRRFLIENEIYCPVHWPVSEYHALTPEERALYDGELSLVCDQRYTEADMDRMIRAIRAFWREA